MENFRTGPFSFRWPECPAYWSLDPLGLERLTAEEATELGFPSLRLNTTVLTQSWDILNAAPAFRSQPGYPNATRDCLPIASTAAASIDRSLLLLAVSHVPHRRFRLLKAQLIRWKSESSLLTFSPPLALLGPFRRPALPAIHSRRLPHPFSQTKRITAQRTSIFAFRTTLSIAGAVFLQRGPPVPALIFCPEFLFVTQMAEIMRYDALVFVSVLHNPEAHKAVELARGPEALVRVSKPPYYPLGSCNWGLSTLVRPWPILTLL
ncbi:hypothetical protein B0H19DRAFT_1292742 [Mycena capillaripes]|nr:hypothetical protein B0H19DRAFT_1292742 [Mycena capillaripes]